MKHIIKVKISSNEVFFVKNQELVEEIQNAELFTKEAAIERRDNLYKNTNIFKGYLVSIVPLDSFDILENKELTTQNVHEIIGKEIQWKAPSDASNKTYGGKAVILGFSENRIKCKNISGDNLEHSFISDNNFCYSDSDRFISFIVY